MKPVPWLPGVVVSASVHIALFGALAVMLPRDTALPPLVLDLTELAPPAAPGAAGGQVAAPPAGPSARGPREARATGGGRRAAAVARAPAAPKLDAPAAPSAPPVPTPNPPPVSREPSVPAEAPPVALVPAFDPASMATPTAPTDAGSHAGPHGGDAAAGHARDDGAGAGRGAGIGGGAGTGDGAGAGGGGRGAGGGSGGGGSGAIALGTPGGEGTAHAEYGAYLGALRRRIQEALEYPATARRRGLTGTVHVEIALTARGVIGGVSLLRSSSHPVLDEAALAAVRRVGPVPFPPALPPRPLTVRLPVVFQLEER